MIAVRSGNVEIKHDESEVGQIQLENWISKHPVVRVSGWGQQRSIMMGDPEHKDNFLFSFGGISASLDTIFCSCGNRNNDGEAKWKETEKQS